MCQAMCYILKKLNIRYINDNIMIILVHLHPQIHKTTYILIMYDRKTFRK